MSHTNGIAIRGVFSATKRTACTILTRMLWAEKTRFSGRIEWKRECLSRSMILRLHVSMRWKGGKVMVGQVASALFARRFFGQCAAAAA